MVKTSNELQHLMRFKEGFKGVFPRDQLPDMREGECLIFNVDTNTLPGKHWIALKLHHNYLFYFDPSANPPMMDVARKYRKPILYLDDNVQPYFSETCGEHCVYFLYKFKPCNSEYKLNMFINKLNQINFS